MPHVLTLHFREHPLFAEMPAKPLDVLERACWPGLVSAEEESAAVDDLYWAAARLDAALKPWVEMARRGVL